MINLNKLKKIDLLWLYNHRCIQHKRRYIFNHLNCFEREVGKIPKQKILFYDIETEDLKADYGIMFSWCIIDNDTGRIYFDSINKEDIRKWKSDAKEDKRIVKSFINTVKQLRGDRLIGHYSSRFDSEFIRTRAVICKIDFPTYGELYQSDTWNILRKKFALSRNSLENSTHKLIGKTRKNHLSLKLKHGCLRGEKWAIDYTINHNIRDVKDTRDLWHSIENYANITNTSI